VYFLHLVKHPDWFIFQCLDRGYREDTTETQRNSNTDRFPAEDLPPASIWIFRYFCYCESQAVKYDNSGAKYVQDKLKNCVFLKKIPGWVPFVCFLVPERPDCPWTGPSPEPQAAKVLLCLAQQMKPRALWPGVQRSTLTSAELMKPPEQSQRRKRSRDNGANTLCQSKPREQF